MMRLKAVLLATLASLALPALGAVGVFAAPAISVDNPNYDATISSAGVVVRHVFTVRNRGDQALAITDVLPSCVCTTASVAKANLPPGASLALAVSVDTTGFAGLVVRTVTLKSNDPDNPMLTLVVSVTNTAASAVKVPPISAADFQKRFYVLVDVRTPEEFASGHLLGAINIPLSELQGNLSAWTSRLPKDVPVILQCKSGVRSEQAGQILMKAGYQNVLTLDGGIVGWTQELGPGYLFGF